MKLVSRDPEEIQGLGAEELWERSWACLEMAHRSGPMAGSPKEDVDSTAKMFQELELVPGEQDACWRNSSFCQLVVDTGLEGMLVEGFVH